MRAVLLVSAVLLAAGCPETFSGDDPDEADTSGSSGVAMCGNGQLDATEEECDESAPPPYDGACNTSCRLGAFGCHPLLPGDRCTTGAAPKCEPAAPADFECAPLGESGPGAPCDAEADCVSGTACVAAPECEAARCCQPFCDLEGGFPVECSSERTCTDYWAHIEVPIPPAGLSYLGVCL